MDNIIALCITVFLISFIAGFSIGGYVCYQNIQIYRKKQGLNPDPLSNK